MDQTTYFLIGYIIAVILLAEYIYHCKYIPTMRKLVEHDYKDF